MSDATSERVNVHIIAKQAVRYDQTRSVTRAEADRLRAAVEDAEKGTPGADTRLEMMVDDLIDHGDVEDGEPITDVEVEWVQP